MAWLISSTGPACALSEVLVGEALGVVLLVSDVVPAVSGRPVVALLLGKFLGL